MADTGDINGSESAEKAYASAAEKAAPKADAQAPAALEFPAKLNRIREAPEEAVKPAAAASPALASAAKVELPAELEADLAKPALKRIAAAKPKAPKAKRIKAAAAPKTAPRKVAAAKKTVAPNELVAAKTAKTAAPATPTKPVKLKIQSAPIKILKRSKDTPMPNTKSATYTPDLKTLVAVAQTKAKLALGKGSAVFGEASGFAKGNVEAVVASGKILANGLQDIGKTYVAESKAAVETVTADVKALAAVKSPTDFVQLQSTILRRNVDRAIALGSQNSEAMLKLVGEAFAPLSARASLAVQKIKQAA